MGGIASVFGVAVSLAIGGVLVGDRSASARSSGSAAAAWIARGAPAGRPAPAAAAARPAAPSRRTALGRADPRAADRARPTQPSTAPKTSAAFSPPNPNEVDSTRR